MLRIEWNRVFLKRGFLWVLLAALAMEALLFVHAVKKEINLDPISLEVFKNYMELYGGELNEEKEAAIEALINERESIEYQRQLLTTAYDANEISAEAYKDELSKLKEKTKGTDGYNKFISLYETGCYETNYIADTSVWNILLPANGFDVIYIFTIIILVLLLFVYDEETGSNRLLITTQAGKRKLQKCRIGSLFFIVVFISLSVFFEKLLLSIFFHIDGFSMPLQTVTSFRYSQASLSLFQAYIVLCIIKLIGGIYLAAAVMLIGELTRSTLNTVFIALNVVCIPVYLLKDSAWKYLLPLPSALLSAGGYLGSTEPGNFTVAENGDLMIKIFRESQLAILFTMDILIPLILSFFIYILWVKHRRTE